MRKTSPFDPNGSMKKRTFERLLMNHHWLHHVVHHTGYWGLACLIWPRFVAPYRWELTRYDMGLRHLGPAFAGYKILHVTDLHAGKAKTSYLRAALETALRERPDLVVITGDLIHYRKHSLQDVERVLEPLKEAWLRDGVLGIFGNHDYHEYSWRNNGPRSAKRGIHQRLRKLMQRLNIRMLHNEQVKIERGGNALTIVGMDELWPRLFDPEKAFAGVSDREAVICLQHNPDGCEQLLNKPWQWMLTGHSHGGQVLLPVLGAMYVPMEKREWLSGFFDFDTGHGRKTMFVSNGIGHSVPLRMRVRPEITLFTLKPL